MEILKPLALIVAAVIVSVFLKGEKREFSLIVTLISSFTVLGFFSLKLGDMLGEILSFFDFDTRETMFAELIMKILGISLITQGVQNSCTDAGETSLGKNAVLIGKLALLILSIPIIKSALSEVRNIMTF